MKAKSLFLVASLFICASIAGAGGGANEDEGNPFKTGRAAKIARDRAHKKKPVALTDEQEQAQKKWRKQVGERAEAKRERVERERFLRDHPGADLTEEPEELDGLAPETAMVGGMIVLANVIYAVLAPGCGNGSF